MPRSSAPKYPCGYCGRERPAEQMIYSHHSGARYCGVETGKCDKRGATMKRQRIAAKVAA